MICRQLADNTTVSWATAGAGGGFRCMSTKSPTSNTSLALREIVEQRRALEGVSRFVDQLSRSALGREASAQEVVEVAQWVARGDRRAAVESVLLTQGSLVRL